MRRPRRRMREALERMQLAFPWHPSRTVSTNEAAGLLGISHDMVLRLIYDGRLEARRKSQKKRSSYLVYHESVMALNDAWRAAASAAPDSAVECTATSR